MKTQMENCKLEKCLLFKAHKFCPVLISFWKALNYIEKAVFFRLLWNNLLKNKKESFPNCTMREYSNLHYIFWEEKLAFKLLFSYKKLIMGLHLFSYNFFQFLSSFTLSKADCFPFHNFYFLYNLLQIIVTEQMSSGKSCFAFFVLFLVKEKGSCIDIQLMERKILIVFSC